MSNDRNEFSGRLWGRGVAKDKMHNAEPERAPSNVPPARAERVYAAYDVREHTQRLHIHCAAQPSRFPAYSCLLDIIYDHDFDKTFTLVYSFMMVEVTGNHIGAIVDAISAGNCERIQEYHRKLYDPADPGAPVIDSITITAATGE
jgi:hypothetical protein